MSGRTPARRGPQGLPETFHEAVERAHPERRVGFGEDLLGAGTHQGHRLDADGHLGIVLDDQILPPAVAIYCHDVETHLPVRHVPESNGDGGIKEGTALYDLSRDHLFIASLETPQELVDR